MRIDASPRYWGPLILPIVTISQRSVFASDCRMKPVLPDVFRQIVVCETLAEGDRPNLNLDDGNLPVMKSLNREPLRRELFTADATKHPDRAQKQ